MTTAQISSDEITVSPKSPMTTATYISLGSWWLATISTVVMMLTARLIAISNPTVFYALSLLVLACVVLGSCGAIISTIMTNGMHRIGALLLIALLVAFGAFSFLSPAPENGLAIVQTVYYIFHLIVLFAATATIFKAHSVSADTSATHTSS